MRSLTRLTVALLLALAGALAACSDDDGGASPDVELEDREGGGGDDRDDTSDDDTSDDDADDDDADDDDPDSEDPDSDDPDTDDDGGELPAGAAPYVDALTATFVADADSLPLDEAQARCVATNIVGVVGVDRLEGAAVSPEDFASDDFDFTGLGLSEDDGFDIVDSFGGCGADFYDLMVDSFAADSSDPDAARACVEAAISPELLREVMARGFVEAGFEDSAEFEAAFGPLFACAFGQLDTDG